MSTVTLVPNAKTGANYVPSSNGKWVRIQVKSQGHVIRNGFETATNMTGFLYVQNEQRAQEYVAMAKANGMQIPGKVIYVDQLTPIMQERADYGMQYPYPFRNGKTELTQEQRIHVQKTAIEKGLVLRQSGQPIYRRKMFTDDLNATSVILSPDNLDEVNALVAATLAAGVDPKAERIAAIQLELKAPGITAKQKTALKAELVELM